MPYDARQRGSPVRSQPLNPKRGMLTILACRWHGRPDGKGVQGPPIIMPLGSSMVSSHPLGLASFPEALMEKAVILESTRCRP